MRKLLALLALLLAPVMLSAQVYVSQAGAGSENGTVGNAYPLSALGTCGHFPAGTLVYFSGNFTFPAATNGGVVPSCGGTLGNPVIYTTDPATRPVLISSPGFNFGGGSGGVVGGLYVNAAYITVGGSVPCGTVTGSTGPTDSPNSCDLIIENTAEGTAYNANNASSMLDLSVLVGAAAQPGIEIKNFSALNTYAVLPPWQISSIGLIGSLYTVTCATACPVGLGKFITIIGSSMSGIGGCQPSVSSACTILLTNANNGGGSGFTATLFAGPAGTGTGTGGWAIDNWGDGNGEGQVNTSAAAFLGFPPGVLIHDGVVAHCNWCIVMNQPASTSSASPQISNMQIYDFDHGFGIGVCGNGGCSDNNVYNGPIINNNHLHDSFNWDQLFDPLNRNLNDSNAQGTNNNHHDPIHLQQDVSGTTQRSFLAPLIYNNLFSGNGGMDTNNWLFLRASTTNEAVFNNVIACQTTGPPTALFGIGNDNNAYPTTFTHNLTIANNTVVPPCSSAGAGATIGAIGVSGRSPAYGDFNFQYFNNIISTIHFGVYVLNDTSTWQSAPGGWDYNYYQDGHTDSGGVAVNFVSSTFGFSSETLAGWQTYLAGAACNNCSPMGTGSPWPATQGQDAHAKFGTAAVLNIAANGVPNALSPVISAGANLTPLCGTIPALCKDIAGNQRPTTGPWDIGAFYTGSVVGVKPFPPLNLSLSVH